MPVGQEACLRLDKLLPKTYERLSIAQGINFLHRMMPDQMKTSHADATLLMLVVIILLIMATPTEAASQYGTSYTETTTMNRETTTADESEEKTNILDRILSRSMQPYWKPVLGIVATALAVILIFIYTFYGSNARTRLFSSYNDIPLAINV